MFSDNKSSKRALWVLLLGTVCISFAAIFVKFIDSSKVGPTAIGFWRTLFGCIILSVWTLAEKQTLLLPKHVYKWSALAGFIFFLDLFFWHRSIIYCGAGMATIIVGTQVFISAVLSHFFYKEKLTVGFFLAAVSAVVGLGFLIGIGSQSIVFSSLYILGIILGLLTSITYASYILTVKRGSHEQGKAGTLAFMAWTSMFTCLFMGVTSLIEGEPFVPPDVRTFAFLFALGLIPQAIGWRAISSSLPKLKASRAALVLLMQSVLATIWGMLFFKEYLELIQIFGAAITLTAIYFGSVRATAVEVSDD
jgi:drug/metabolite transporter (DMT)-like permease